MAWAISKPVRGVCGNFRFKFYDLTDCQGGTDANSCIPGQIAINFVTGTDISANTGSLMARRLNWTGTAEAGAVANKLDDNSEEFNSVLSGLQAWDTTNLDGPGIINFVHADATLLELFTPGTATAVDIFAAGSEGYRICSDRIVMTTVVADDQDATLIIIGR